VLLALLAGCAPSAAPAATPTTAGAPAARTSLTVVNTAVTGAFSALWTGMEAGYFADEGLDVQITNVNDTSRAVAVLLSGQAQFSPLDGQVVIQANIKGANLRELAAATNHLVFSVMADPSIRSAEDLRGKRLGITGPGSSTDTAARQALALWKLKPDEDVTLVGLQTVPNILTGLTAHQVEAGVVSPPTNTRARQAGLQELLNLAKEGPVWPSVAFGATQDYVAKNPQVALGFVRAYSRGIYRFKTDKAFALQTLAKYLQLNDQSVLEDTWQQFSQYIDDVPYVNADGVTNAINYVAQSQPEAGGTTPDRYVDMQFVKQLDEAGFYKQLWGR
jgi:NitT/TauT family transport system substrate-binding protein